MFVKRHTMIRSFMLDVMDVRDGFTRNVLTLLKSIFFSVFLF